VLKSCFILALFRLPKRQQGDGDVLRLTISVLRLGVGEMPLGIGRADGGGGAIHSAKFKTERFRQEFDLGPIGQTPQSLKNQ
jgi:hypothetical protein